MCACFEQLKREVEPDLVLTHYREDRHQDHRLVPELTYNTFRDHLILEYEVMKTDGDPGNPNVYVPLDTRTCTCLSTPERSIARCGYWRIGSAPNATSAGSAKARPTGCCGYLVSKPALGAATPRRSTAGES
jgi:hypothetical protein